jgi:hypothetical protein
VRLEATFENGSVVLGESVLRALKQNRNSGSQRTAIPEHPSALPPRWKPSCADLIVLVPAASIQALSTICSWTASASDRGISALKIYVCNIMTRMVKRRIIPRPIT